MCFYEAEQIINWRVERIAEKPVLTLVVLRETADVFKGEDYFEAEAIPQIRVLRLVRSAKDEGRSANSKGTAPEDRRPTENGSPGGRTLPVYVVEIWQELEDEHDSSKKEWKLVETRKPTRAGKPLTFIPFVFHGPKDDSPDPEKPPLDDVIQLGIGIMLYVADHTESFRRPLITSLPPICRSGSGQ